MIRPFTLLYFTLAVILHLAALPFLLLLSFKTKYRESIPARFFLRNNPRFQEDDIWFHVCSLGEARALHPLFEALTGRQVSISTVTQTGHTEASKYKAEVRYLPFESLLPFWIKKHRMLVVLEAEFWYLLFVVASAKGAKVVLLNARMTERSFPKYMRLRWFYSRMFRQVDKIFCQSEADKKRFKALGATNIEVVGNIKLAQKIAASKTYAKPRGEVIVAASTHEGEEELVVEAYLAYKKEHNAKLIVVPRHPERFEKVYTLLKKMKHDDMTLSRWSESSDLEADIVLVDAMGELNNIYAISDIAILGGAFNENVGGHNPLEPAYFRCKIITGRHAFMQKELFKYVHNVQEVEKNKITDALQKAQSMKNAYVDEKIDLESIIRYLNK
ncbi:MAG: lipid IV(A) 3-deoxy-D-manno-octulosonic acid transferase [Helicobacteraceae bacterium]|jgi:3-deoxy-D-manno-octulosonic-acid transferase|nr:lipid IV(A) 3-deoxy-D-manno-octulosonic acid transferase [Helicobacteraceae bacterium]